MAGGLTAKAAASQVSIGATRQAQHSVYLDGLTVGILFAGPPGVAALQVCRRDLEVAGLVGAGPLGGAEEAVGAVGGLALTGGGVDLLDVHTACEQAAGATCWCVLW